jgi:KDO2-lipid IV(A) lauroyltransferase
MELVRVPPAQWSTARRWKNGAIVIAARVALACVRPIPRALLVAMGRVVGVLAWMIAGEARAIARRNVDRVYGARRENARLVRRCFVELGAMLGDALTLLRPRTRGIDRLPMTDDARAVIDAARAHGRGVVLITAHLGPWERLSAAVVESGYALTIPVRPSYDPRLDALVHAPLRRGRGVAIDRDAPGTPRALLRALRGNECVGFLVDVRTRVASVTVPFLGHDAPTPSAPARLALRTGAPVVCLFATREGVRAERVRDVETPRADGIDDGVIALTARINTSLGAAILREPERWIWMHDRWP